MEREKETNSQIINACLDGDILQMRQLCEQSPNSINLSGLAGYPPIHYAIYKNKHELVTYLLRNNADVNLPNSKGDNSLHAAAILGDHYLLSIFIPLCPNIEVGNLNRESPLDIVSRLPSVEDLQYPLIFNGWNSTDDQSNFIDQIISGRKICKEMLVKEITKRKEDSITFIKYSLCENHVKNSNLRNIYHDHKNHAARRFTSSISFPGAKTPLKWSDQTLDLYHSRPDIIRELDVRLCAYDIVDRSISAAIRHVTTHRVCK